MFIPKLAFGLSGNKHERVLLFQGMQIILKDNFQEFKECRNVLERQV